MKAARVLAAIAVALALQTTLTQFVIRGTVAFDLVLVVVVYVALTSGPVTGLLSGSVAGLAQDALASASGVAGMGLASGVIGIGGLAKTVVGFLAGVIGMQFIVTQQVPRFVVFLGATLVHGVVFNGLYLLVAPRSFSMPFASVASQAVGNAVVGVVAFQLVEFLPGAVERRRTGRTRARR